ncbi:MAG: outer membrane protein assembly factor BamB [Magnetococcales bacterium]|nr:outer membrane protein assembly factor BamB [Magnetococcales bacterium]
MVGKIRFSFVIILTALLFSGCSYMPDWFWIDDEEEISGYKEPDPGRLVAIDEEWDRGIEGEPDEYMSHPRQIAVTEEAVFVGTFEGLVVKVDKSRGKVIWESELDSSVSGGVATDGSRVFAGTVAGNMVALSRENGEKLWQSQVSTSVASAPLVVGGRVIFTTLNNRTYALDVNSGKLLWTHSSVPVALVVQGAATPTTNGRTVFVGYSTGEVFALNLREGKPLWGKNLSRLMGRSEIDRLHDVDGEVVVGPSGMDTPIPKVYVVNHQGSVMGIQSNGGVEVWKSKFSAIRRPLLWGNQLFVVNVEGQIVSISAKDGLEVWRTRISDGYLSAPVRFGDQIIVGDSKGRLFSIDPASGRVTGLNHLNDPIIATPVVDGSSLYIWTNEGDLIKYKAQ